MDKSKRNVFVSTGRKTKYKMTKIIDFSREARRQFYIEIGVSRLQRILICSLFIASIWCVADLMSGSFVINFRDDLICLGLGVVAERLIPWGKVIVSPSS